MLQGAEFDTAEPPSVGVTVEVRVAVGIEDGVERGQDETEAPETKHGPHDAIAGARAAQRDQPGKERVEEDVSGERPGGRVPEGAEGG